jgi:hypothetical protein
MYVRREKEKIRNKKEASFMIYIFSKYDQKAGKSVKKNNLYIFLGIQFNPIQSNPVIGGSQSRQAMKLLNFYTELSYPSSECMNGIGLGLSLLLSSFLAFHTSCHLALSRTNPPSAPFIRSWLTIFPLISTYKFRMYDS